MRQSISTLPIILTFMIFFVGRTFWCKEKWKKKIFIPINFPSSLDFFLIEQNWKIVNTRTTRHERKSCILQYRLFINYQSRLLYISHFKEGAPLKNYKIFNYILSTYFASATFLHLRISLTFCILLFTLLVFQLFSYFLSSECQECKVT